MLNGKQEEVAEIRQVKNSIFPIAELFDSIQGEGQWVGTRMFFIRLAGCSVGKIFQGQKKIDDKTKRVPQPHADARFRILPIYTEQCTTYDGRTFDCDTDYRVKHRLNIDQIAALIPDGIKHICLTGGEPLIHDLNEILLLAHGLNIHVHIETSGTKHLDEAFPGLSFVELNKIWVAVSPKLDFHEKMIRRADELKLLVDENFDVKALPPVILKHPCVFLQPINAEETVSQENVKRCTKLQQEFPQWSISTQLHKFLKVR